MTRKRLCEDTSRGRWGKSVRRERSMLWSGAGASKTTARRLARLSTRCARWPKRRMWRRPAHQADEALRAAVHGGRLSSAMAREKADQLAELERTLSIV